MSPTTYHPFSFDQAIEGYLRSHGQLSFLQIGRHDGASIDPLSPHIAGGNLTGVIVEPVPMHFERLQAFHAGSDRIKMENCAIALPGQTSPVEGNGISHRSPYQSYDAVIAKHGVQRIDLLQIHAGRHACELLKAFDVQRHRPVIVRYTCRDMTPEDRAAAEQLLVSHGYVLNSNDHDTFAVRGLLIQNPESDIASLLQVADHLLNEGRAEQAGKIYGYVLQVAPNNFPAMFNAAIAATQQALHAEAVQLVTRALLMAPAHINIASHAREIRWRAGCAFDELMAKNEVVAAEPIIDALAEAKPELYLVTALSVARNLNRAEKAVAYARRILEFDPLSWPAHAALYTEADRRGDVGTSLYHLTQAAKARLKAPGDKDRVAARAARSAISTILGHPTHPEGLALVDELRAAVAARPQEFDNEEDRIMDRFIRVSLETLDTSIFRLPLSDDPPAAPPLTYADFAGKVLTADEWRSRLLAKGPKVVFLAAADEVYLRRYGANYLHSLLRRCDIDCAVILCLVGDPKNLASVIGEIGVQDPRVFYMVDTYDPANGVTVYMTRSRKDNASNVYYQSVRFLVLGHLLHRLNLPLIVSDIDLMLQGSVAGLLASQGDAQVVLNRNDSQISYGSRYTANLLLIRPGPTSRQFARILRVFLERALRHNPIEMFIDQVALVLAHYYCRMHGLDSFAHFSDKDINNVMFNETDMGEDTIRLARTYVFFAYYGSQGESAEKLMNRIAGRT